MDFLANEDTPQLYCTCGRGPRSTLRVLRHGLEVTEMAVSELPGNPNAVWTVKKRAEGKQSPYPPTPILLHYDLLAMFLMSIVKRVSKGCIDPTKKDWLFKKVHLD